MLIDYKCCFCLFLVTIGSVPAWSYIVHTPNGAVDGTVFKTVSGRAINAFLGIPYARAPQYKYRFKDPQPPCNWKGILPAKEFRQRCIQFTFKPPDQAALGIEDCLFLNIFTPVVSNSSKLDVLFFIHGGGFMTGGADMYTPHFILDRQNIVFVTVNYRLGPFGFLSTEDEVIPGNFGLKDQVFALRWVKKNIERFGGDKDKITIAGEDAGAASVHFHYLSPTSRDLFNQGISLSGSAFCPWALAENARLKAVELAKKMKCKNPTDTSRGILDCLQESSPHVLLMWTESLYMHWHFMPLSPFGPVVEKKSNKAFLYANPYKLIAEGSIKDAPWLVGLTTHEGLYPAAKFVKNHGVLEEMEENWQDIAPHLLDYNHTVPQAMLHSVSEKIRQFYFEDEEISVKRRKELIRMLSDRLFVADTESAVRLQASVMKSLVFLYTFGYRGKYSKANLLCKCKDNFGASHGDDLLYLFHTEGFNVTESQFSEAMVWRMVDILITFVKTGIPKVDDETMWKPVQPEAVRGGPVHYMQITNSKDIDLYDSVDLGNRQFWSGLHLAELKNVVDEHKRFFEEL